MKALILCGGQGTRLRPLINNIPKPLIQIQDRPLLEHIIKLYRKYNVNEILLSVGYLKEKIMDYFGNGADFGVKIKYIEEDEPLGTAGPIRLAKNLSDETFFACNGDDLTTVNLKEMLKFHKRNKALATIALTKVRDTSLYGVAKMNKNKIIEFIEKPKTVMSNLINSGLYIMEPEIIGLIPMGNSSLERNIFPKIAGMGRFML